MTVKFIEASADNQKGFRIGREQSLFVGNVTFTVTGVKFGEYEITEDDGTKKPTKYASISQSILLTTSLGEDISLKSLLNKRRVIYDKEGHAIVVEKAGFKGALLQHMEQLGRRDDDSAMLKGTVKEVGDHALQFFQGKTIICVDVPGLGRDDKNRLVPLLSPCIQFNFQ